MHKKNLIVALIAGVVTVAIAAVVTFVYLDARLDLNDRNPSTVTSTTGSDELVVIAENLNTPWSIVFYDDVALVSSRDTGEILALNTDEGTSRVVGTVQGVEHGGEGGLLGLALDNQRRLYAYYTTANDNRISRFNIDGGASNPSLGESETVVAGLPRASIHNGGRIAFGPDNLLYATVGDAGNTASAQDISNLGGKILRMTVDGDVPADNPFPDSLVYSYGHRNPQGIAWSDDGTMYASEFGQNTWDELNVIEAGSNYGWPEVEGIENREGFVDPVQQWEPSEASPSGMTYDNGLLYIANLRGAVLRTVPTASPDSSRELYKDEFGRIRDVVTAPDGRIWFVSSNTDGRGSPAGNDDRILSIPAERQS